MVTRGETIREMRRKRGMTQKQLAQVTGIHQPSLSAYERGPVEPDEATFARIIGATRPLPSIVLRRHRNAVRHAASRNRIDDVRVFGSVARGVDTVDSDIDLLVTYAADASLLDAAGFQSAAQEILGYPVDVVGDRSTGAAMPRILAEAQAL